METRLTSKNKEASKQVLVKENNDPEEGRGGEGGELRTHLKPQSRERSAGSSEPLPLSWERSLGLLRRGSGAGPRGRGGPASRERLREGFAPRPGAEPSSLQRRGRGLCAPRPPPHRGGSHLLYPCQQRGGSGGSARPRPSAAPPAPHRGMLALCPAGTRT